MQKLENYTLQKFLERLKDDLESENENRKYENISEAHKPAISLNTATSSWRYALIAVNESLKSKSRFDKAERSVNLWASNPFRHNNMGALKISRF